MSTSCRARPEFNSRKIRFAIESLKVIASQTASDDALMSALTVLVLQASYALIQFQETDSCTALTASGL